MRYKRYVTPWIDILMLSPDELQTILEGTHWEAREFFDKGDGVYISILEKRQ